MKTLQLNPEELERDALLQFYATHTVEKMLASGIAQYMRSAPSRPRQLLDGAERRLVEEATAKGLMSFEDAEFAAAIKWVAAGLHIEVNVPKFLEKLKG